MDTAIATVITAVIGLAGAITVAVINKYGRHSPKAEDEKSSASIIDGSPIADIRGTWAAAGMDDQFTIISLKERRVEGERNFKGSDGLRRKYRMIGYFDGMLLALAATCDDPKENRTLSIVLKRVGGNKFIGVKTIYNENRIVSTRQREWVRQL